MSDVVPGSDNLKSKKIARELSFHSAITNIIREIEAIKFTLNNAIVGSMQDFENRSNDFSNYIENNAEKIIEPGKETSYKLDMRNAHALQENLERLQVAVLGPEILANAMFISLIVRWDAYFANILRLLFLSKADLIDSSQRSIVFSELTKFPSIEAARTKIMEAEIEDVMRESHTKQFDTLNRYLGKKENEKTLKDIEEWPFFVEMTERRNLIVHTDNIVSQQYIDVCKKNKCIIKDFKIGDKVGITKAYMQEACDVLTRLAFILGHYIWQKFRAGEVKARESHLLQTTYALIRDERYSVAERLIEDFLQDRRNHQNEYTRKACHINLAQAYKWSGNESKCKSTLARESWSHSRDNFVIASLVLIDDFDGAALLMKKLGITDEITRSDYDEWPLFKKFRESEIFKKAYGEIFGEETTTKEVEQPKIESPKDEKNDSTDDETTLH